MIIQLTGALLVLGATIWMGIYFAAKEKYRLQELEELERSILLFEGQIQYLSAPLPEVLESTAWKMDGVMGDVFRQAAKRMQERDGDSAEEIWAEVWQSKAEQLFLTEEDMEAVLLFGKTLGYLDKEQQENNIRLLLRYIRNALEQGRKRLDKNGRLYYGMGGLSGLLVVVMLL